MQQLRLPALFLLFISNLAWSATTLDQTRLHIQEGHYKEALKQTKKLLEQQPQNIEAQFMHGIALYKLGQTKKAITFFKKLTLSHPNLPEPRNNLAVLYAQQGQYQKAEQALQSALNTHPSYTAAHDNISDIYKELASIAYNKALNPNKNNKLDNIQLRLIDNLHSYQATTNIEAIPASLDTPRSTYSEHQKNADINKATEAVLAWATAWSQQDPKGYLGYYSTGFTLPANRSRRDWENLRTKRLQAPKFIKISIRDMKAEQLNNQIVSVSFKQHYLSNQLTEISSKLLILRYEQNQWRIITETETK